MSLEEARCRAHSVLASLNNKGEEIIVASSEETRGGRGEAVRGLRETLEGQHQKGRPKLFQELDSPVVSWNAGRRNHKAKREAMVRLASCDPFAADRAVSVLSVLMHRAELHGYRLEGSIPCAGIRRYRRCGRERFLPPEEIQRLGVVLTQHENVRPLEVATIRLLLLTGCRRSEILTLKRPDYRKGYLYLRDSKTGPRTVWLSSPARGILNGLPRCRVWIFPARRKRSHFCPTTLDQFWWKVRDEGDLGDVRLHDLRYSVASQAALKGGSASGGRSAS